MTTFQKIIYISHPFQDNIENQYKVEKIIKILIKKFPNILFISPIHTFGFLYKDVEYNVGLDMTITLLKKCDEMWVFGEWFNSTGCKKEIEACILHRIPYKIIPESTCYKNTLHIEMDGDCLECEFADVDDAGIYCDMKTIMKIINDKEEKLK